MTAKPDPQRARLIKLVHVGAKALKMTDDARRDLMERAAGKRSAKDMTARELARVVDAMKAIGFKPQAASDTGAKARRASRSPLVAKARALWISLHELGCVRDPADTALAAFVRKTTTVEAVDWLTPAQANKVIEGLKDLAARPCDEGGGGVDWKASDNPRRCVVEAQWRRLVALGVIDHPEFVGPVDFARGFTGKAGFQFYDDADFDKVIRALGAKLRGALSRARA